IAKARNGPNSAVTSRSRPDKNNNDDDTPPQNKQATTPVSHNTGVLFLWAVGLARTDGRAARPVAGRAAHRRGRAASSPLQAARQQTRNEKFSLS
ncbi:MAG TPA: hypothetical protein VG994_01665, partial [Steroidobacteraceae bacterium]|nr:hypothetical protein [Steroidobacteraceae bacterium]